MSEYQAGQGIFKTYTKTPDSYPTWKETEGMNGDDCPHTIGASMRQVAVKVDGKWCSARFYQWLAVLVFICEHQSRIRSLRESLKESLDDVPHVVEICNQRFVAPNGGHFYIIDKRPDGETDGVTFLRDDGVEYFCKVHHGYDSEEILGVKIDDNSD